MTSKQVFEATLIELDKQSAPAVTLESFNYFFNKAINQFVNKQYNVGVDTDQQRTDDIRVLKATTILTPYKKPKTLNQEIQKLLKDGDSSLTLNTGDLDVFSPYGATYEFNLPSDYLHLLNCICLFRVKKRINCPYNVGDIIKKGATKCNADTWPMIIDNLYMRPSYRRPYYYINNVNTQLQNPTNPIKSDSSIQSSIQYTGTDINTKEHFETDLTNTNIATTSPVSGGSSSEQVQTWETVYNYTGHDLTSQIPTSYTKPNNRNLSIKIGDESSNDSTVAKTAGHRYGNSSNVRLEVRYGQDSSVFELIGIMIDYIKAPQFIRLTQKQLDLTEDSSQTLEFPDYICQEIINELVKLIMENASDPRMQTQPAVSMSIAAPAQAQTTQNSKK